jgi:hypothetical protein
MGYRVLFEATDSKWSEQLANARRSDEEALSHGIAPEAINALPSRQWADGLMELIVCKNQYGWCVRHQINDGNGNMSGNFDSKDAAITWAKDYYDSIPSNCRVRMAA